MQARTVWALVVGFLLGVLFASTVPLSWPAAALCALIGFASSALAVLGHGRRAVLMGVAIACFAGSLGMLRVQGAAPARDAVLDGEVGKRVIVVGTVVAEPDVRDTSVRLTVRAEDLLGKSGTSTVRANVLVIAPAHAEAAYGDVIRASGKLRYPEAFDAGEGRQFDYPMYLAKDGILYELAFATIVPTGERRANPLTGAALATKRVFLDGLQRALPEPEAGLAGGITVGDKRSIGKELSDTFRTASLVHIVVLSGYNITIVLNMAAHLLPRAARFGASGVIVAFFVLMTGGAASAVRAGAMALLATYARLTGRQFIALRVLGVVAAAMVAWNPLMLVYDPSFQLSVLATLGLVLFTPVIAERSSFITERFGMREIVSSTIGTQLMVLPLLLYQNGNLSLVALPANLLALFPIPYAMLASCFAAVGGLALGPYAFIAGLPAYVLLAYVIGVARFFADLPFASVQVPAFPVWIMCLMYALVFGTYISMKNKTHGNESRASTA